MTALVFITTIHNKNFHGKEVHLPIWIGRSFNSIADYISQKKNSGITITPVTNNVIVVGYLSWDAFEEQHGSNVLTTILITVPQPLSAWIQYLNAMRFMPAAT